MRQKGKQLVLVLKFIRYEIVSKMILQIIVGTLLTKLVIIKKVLKRKYSFDEVGRHSKSQHQSLLKSMNYRSQ